LTWHHVAALLIAAAMVIACGLSEKCGAASFGSVVQLATAIVAGAFGHAGAQARARQKPDQANESTSHGGP
jgi:hypothetical protein